VATASCRRRQPSATEKCHGGLMVNPRSKKKH